MIRYLCSELVTLKHGARETVVNLEEIQADAALIESEEPIATGENVELRCREHIFSGVVTLAEKHEFGWRAEIAFAPEVCWSPELFRPEHLLNPADIPG